jgi:hypothetical protein
VRHATLAALARELHPCALCKRAFLLLVLHAGKWRVHGLSAWWQASKRTAAALAVHATRTSQLARLSRGVARQRRCGARRQRQWPARRQTMHERLREPARHRTLARARCARAPRPPRARAARHASSPASAARHGRPANRTCRSWPRSTTGSPESARSQPRASARSPPARGRRARRQRGRASARQLAPCHCSASARPRGQPARRRAAACAPRALRVRRAAARGAVSRTGTAGARASVSTCQPSLNWRGRRRPAPAARLAHATRCAHARARARPSPWQHGALMRLPSPHLRRRRRGRRSLPGFLERGAAAAYRRSRCTGTPAPRGDRCDARVRPRMRRRGLVPGPHGAPGGRLSPKCAVFCVAGIARRTRLTPRGAARWNAFSAGRRKRGRGHQLICRRLIPYLISERMLLLPLLLLCCRRSYRGTRQQHEPRRLRASGTVQLMPAGTAVLLSCCPAAGRLKLVTSIRSAARPSAAARPPRPPATTNRPLQWRSSRWVMRWTAS